MNIIELMDNKNYLTVDDVTISDLKELGEVITEDMSIGSLMECLENLYNEASMEDY